MSRRQLFSFRSALAFAAAMVAMRPCGRRFSPMRRNTTVCSHKYHVSFAPGRTARCRGDRVRGWLGRGARPDAPRMRDGCARAVGRRRSGMPLRSFGSAAGPAFQGLVLRTKSGAAAGTGTDRVKRPVGDCDCLIIGSGSPTATASLLDIILLIGRKRSGPPALRSRPSLPRGAVTDRWRAGPGASRCAGRPTATARGSSAPGGHSRP